MDLIDNKYVQGALGAIVGSIGTVFVFRNRVNKLEQEHMEFRKETNIMFREIRADIKMLLLIGSRRKDIEMSNKVSREQD